MKPDEIEWTKRCFDEEFARSEAQQYPQGFPVLPPIPVERYTDPHFYELEMRHLWSKSWLIAGHAEELPEAGCWKLWTRAGLPVLIVRGKDCVIRAFHNTCRHRGASLVRGTSGKTKVFDCKFHAWTYDLDGQLLFVPAEHEFPGLDKTQNGLVPLRCEMWGNLIFVNRDMNAVPLMQHLGKAAQKLADFDFDHRRIRTILPYDLPCNWKIIMDAFQESYHLDATHPKSVAPFLDYRGNVIEMWPNGHSMLTVPGRRELAKLGDQFVLDAGGNSTDPRHEITRTANISFTIYPNIIGTCAEFQFPILAFWPTGINTTHVEIIITEPENCPDMDPAIAQNTVERFAAVMQEDMSNVAAVQQSFASGVLPSIRLGYQERRIYQFHEQLDRDIGAENVRPELRIKPLLARYIAS